MAGRRSDKRSMDHVSDTATSLLKSDKGGGMKKKFLLLSLATLVLGTMAAISGDYDLQALNARLADQEARLANQDAMLNDLRARINFERSGTAGVAGPAGSAESLLSIRKNAAVTVGGLVKTQYVYTNAKIDMIGDIEQPGLGMRRVADWKTGDLSIGDAEVAVKIDVNDNFDAFLNIDLHSDFKNDYHNAQTYYVRWKNICNTGFGIKVGRDDLVFGEDGVGELDSYVQGSGDGLGSINLTDSLKFLNVPDITVVPPHNGRDIKGVTQITPYWEGLDGKLSAELSFMQHIYEFDTTYASTTTDILLPMTIYARQKDGVMKFRSRNYGLGTMSARIRYSPIEDLKLTLSAANYHSNGNSHVGLLTGLLGSAGLGSAFGYELDPFFKKNNTLVGLAFNYRPRYFNRLAVWGQWIYGNNVSFIRGMDSHALNFGLSYDFMDRLTAFVQGDWLRTKYDNAGVNLKGQAWAVYAGLQYRLPYGAYFEAGWKHEKNKYKLSGATLAKIKADTIYGMIGFNF